MTRYTKKIDKNYICKMNEYMWTDKSYNHKSYNHSRLGIDKLGKLEDIEEELGVDLIKLLTARTIFTIDNDYGISYHIDIENGGVYTSKYDADDEFYPFSDYGKTWSFTMEKLEK